MKYLALILIYLATAFISYKLAVHIGAVEAFWLVIIGYVILVINAYFENK